MLIGVLVEAIAGICRQIERNIRPPLLILPRLRIAEVRPFYLAGALQQPDALGCGCRSIAVQKDRIRRDHAVIGGQRRLIVSIGSARDSMDGQLRGGLNDFFHAIEVLDARKLDQNLIVAEAILLDHRFGDAELVDALADGLNRGIERALVHIPDRRLLHRQGQAAVVAGAHLIVAVVLPGREAARVGQLATGNA